MDSRFACNVLEWPRYKGLLRLPNDYREWQKTKKLSWLAANYYPRCVKWIDDWVTTEKKSSKLEICIGDYASLKSNQLSYINSIVDFFDGSDSVKVDVLPDLSDPILHYRRADMNEWRDSFTTESRMIMNAELPDYLARRFSWPLD